MIYIHTHIYIYIHMHLFSYILLKWPKLDTGLKHKTILFKIRMFKERGSCLRIWVSAPEFIQTEAEETQLEV